MAEQKAGASTRQSERDNLRLAIANRSYARLDACGITVRMADYPMIGISREYARRMWDYAYPPSRLDRFLLWLRPNERKKRSLLWRDATTDTRAHFMNALMTTAQEALDRIPE